MEDGAKIDIDASGRVWAYHEDGSRRCLFQNEDGEAVYKFPKRNGYRRIGQVLDFGKQLVLILTKGKS